MAESVKKGYIARHLAGKERNDDEIVSNAPESRLKLFWDILKGRLGRLALLNILMVLFFAPLVAVIVLRTITVGSLIATGPYGTPGAMLPAYPDVTGYAEGIVFRSDLFYFGLLIPACLIGGIGLSGGAYLIRNLVRTNGVFDWKDFLRGIKRNVFVVLGATALFSFILFAARYLGNYAELQIAEGSALSPYLLASEIIGYILVGVVGLICLWMVALGVNYKHNAWTLFRNAVIMTFRHLPLTVVFAAAAVWPIILILFINGIIYTIFLGLIALIGISYLLLVWMSFTQHIFDKYVSPESVVWATAESAQTDEKADAKAAKKQAENDAEAKRLAVVMYGKSELAARPYQPFAEDKTALYELPDAYSREDIRKLAESRENLSREVDAYVKAHKDEPRYVEYNKQFENRDRALEDKKKGKRKRAPKPPKMLKV